MLVADLRTSAAFAPDAVKRNSVTASLLCQLGAPDAGLALIESIIQQREPSKPPSTDAYYSRALCHLALGKIDSALRDTSCITRINPNHLLAFSLRAVCLFQMGDTDLALKQMRHFLTRKKAQICNQPEENFVARRPEAEQAAVMADLARVALLQKDFDVAVCEVTLQPVVLCLRVSRALSGEASDPAARLCRVSSAAVLRVSSPAYKGG